MTTTWSNSMPFTLRKLLLKTILDCFFFWKYTSISWVYEDVLSRSLDNSWIVLLRIIGWSSAMWRTVAVSFFPIKYFRIKARDLTAMSLDKLMSSENSIRFDFNPSISSPCFGSQKKTKLTDYLTSCTFTSVKWSRSFKCLI